MYTLDEDTEISDFLSGMLGNAWLIFILHITEVINVNTKQQLISGTLCLMLGMFVQIKTLKKQVIKLSNDQSKKSSLSNN